MGEHIWWITLHNNYLLFGKNDEFSVQVLKKYKNMFIFQLVIQL